MDIGPSSVPRDAKIPNRCGRAGRRLHKLLARGRAPLPILELPKRSDGTENDFPSGLFIDEKEAVAYRVENCRGLALDRSTAFERRKARARSFNSVRTINEEPSGALSTASNARSGAVST
ncbi:MAG: hypothetical protein H0W63_10820 [Gemmatimonadaceae bacterium]|nr:hypothetical protein [Gemmatimonadaceae bacterium]